MSQEPIDEAESAMQAQESNGSQSETEFQYYLPRYSGLRAMFTGGGGSSSSIGYGGMDT